MKIKHLLFLLVIITLFGCDIENKNKEYSFKDFIIKNKFFNVDSSTFLLCNKKIFNNKNKQYFSLLNNSNGKFEVYNFPQLTKIFTKKSININSNIIDYDIHNFDTIYILYNNRLLIRTDTSFHVREQFFLNIKSLDYGNSYTLLNFFLQPLIVKNNVAHIFHYPTQVLNTKEKIMEYSKKKLELHISLQKPPILKKQNGTFPLKYQTNSYYNFHPYRLFAGNKEIFHYAKSDCIFINSKSYYFKSNYSEFTPFNVSKISDFNYIKKYLIENSDYGLLLFDKSRELYYRVCKHPMKYENSDGSLNIIGDEKWSIIIADTSFNVIKEVIFPPSYSLSDIYISNKGVLIKKNNSNKYNNEKIEFDIFKF